MTVKRQTLAVTAILLMPVWAFAEGSYNSSQDPEPLNASEEVQTAVDASEFTLFPERKGGFVDASPYLVRGQSPFYQDSVARLGWWGVSSEGSPSGVGEWTGLNSMAFWDVDSLTSDGTRTVDFSLSGPLDETTDLHWYLYSPMLTADVDFDRFIHRSALADLEPFLNTPGNSRLDGQDLTETTDHAIRIQELDAKFSGQLTKNVKWHLDVWGMRKFGERESLALDHDCSGACHVMAQTQSINWLTMEVKPGIEVDMGPVTVEYTRTMRAFEQGDEIVTRSYNGRPSEIATGVQVPYGVVPENYTEIDKIKIGADLGQHTRLYTNMFTGNTHNRYRENDRGFWGVDMRVTNESIDGLRLTAYGKRFEQNHDLPSNFPEASLFPPGEVESYVVDNPPVNRQFTKAGLKGRWTPFRTSHRWRGFALTSGYEYKEIQRQNAEYDILGLPGGPGAVFTQPDTITNNFHCGTEMRWSANFDTYLRYRMVTTENPLFGVTPQDQTVTQADLGGALNTNLPTQQDFIEVGGTWTPTYNFMLSGMVGLEIANHRSSATEFNEDSYPITFSAWYAPTCRWSLSGALGFYSNWISQDVTIGSGNPIFGGGPPPFPGGGGTEAHDTLPADFTGRSDVITLASHYSLTERLALTGDFQFVRAQNTWSIASPAGADYSALPGFSAVIIETTRFGAGLEYELGCNSSCFFKYMYYDYSDKTGDILSGTYHMILGGLAARF